MFQRLNYYSRYNRIKTPQDIKSLYHFMTNIDLVGSIDDTYAFHIRRQNFRIETGEMAQSLSPIKQFSKDAEYPKSDKSSEHKRYSSYDPFRNDRLRKQKVEEQVVEQDNNVLQDSQNLSQPPNSTNPHEQNQVTQSIRNPTNLQEMNCLQTQSIPHDGQSDQFSECQPAHFPLVSSKHQNNESSYMQKSNEDNFSSVQLGHIFDLRKNSMNEHQLAEVQCQYSKSERLHRVQGSDIQIDSQYQHQIDHDFVAANEDQNIDNQIHMHKEDQDYIQNNQIDQLQEQKEESGEESDQQNQQNSRKQQNSSHHSNQNHEYNKDSQKESENENILDSVSEDENYSPQESEKQFKPKQNTLQNMHFGYEDKQQMRIGYQNYTAAEITDSLQKMKRQLNRNPINLEQNDKVETSIIQDNQNQKSKTSIPERKPFKKFMMNKKLNPRMTTSTIVNQIGEKKPKKVNFKKMMKKQEKSENKITFDELISSRKLKKNENKNVNENKTKLLQAFFDQN